MCWRRGGFLRQSVLEEIRIINQNDEAAPLVVKADLPAIPLLICSKYPSCEKVPITNPSPPQVYNHFKSMGFYDINNYGRQYWNF
jgi:hypothetical protein